MNKKYRRLFIAFICVWLIALVAWYLRHANFAVLTPRGPIAAKEKGLMLLTLGLALIVVVPVYVLTFLIAWRYREGNKNAAYQPDLSGNLGAELVWWGIPAVIILVLSIITWQTSHSLDPHQAIASRAKPLTIEVIALDWKWLFIYPDQRIASLNFLQVPVNTPLNFDITADAPMNSFWIPQLGGQIYAMPGMSSPLHLMAGQIGDYQGSSANLSGSGFADMHFIAHASSDNDFKAWVQTAASQPRVLDQQTYDELAKPSQNNSPTLYASADPNIYSRVILKYMTPEKT